MVSRLSFLPLICYAIVLAYAAYAWWELGHWPSYAHPDPKTLPQGGLLTLAGAVLVVGACTLVLLPLGYLGWRAAVAARREPLPSHRVPVIGYLAGLAVWLSDLAAAFTPLPWTSTISWLLD